jgi:hypothetical protein
MVGVLAVLIFTGPRDRVTHIESARRLEGPCQMPTPISPELERDRALDMAAVGLLDG